MARSEQDVRTNPIAGDIVLEGDCARCEVTAIEPRWIRYTLSNPKAKDVINSIPMEGCRMRLGMWRGLMKSATVLNIAQEPRHAQ